VKRVAHVVLASNADIARMRGLDGELHAFLSAPANLTRHGRVALERASAETDALLLKRLRDPGTDANRANDALIAIAHDLVRPGDREFERLRVADADAHNLVDDYVFTVYVVPGQA
jgi:hypothetical protein